MLDHKAKAELRARVLDQLKSIFDLDVQEQATAFPPQVRYFFFLLPLLTDLDPLVAKQSLNRCKNNRSKWYRPLTLSPLVLTLLMRAVCFCWC